MEDRVNRSKKVREIANKLNDLGYPCCRCMNCDTCKMAEDILNKKIPMPTEKLR
jgi:hypothetical protein